MKTFEELFPGLKFTDCKKEPISDADKKRNREDDLMELASMERRLTELRKEVFRKRKELGVER